MTGFISVGLNAVVFAVDRGEGRVLATHQKEGGLPSLPYKALSADDGRTLEHALRDLVKKQTGFQLGHVEQLYTFADPWRQFSLSQKLLSERLVSIAYLALTPEARDVTATGGHWIDWTSLFPYEDHRQGLPEKALSLIREKGEAWAWTTSEIYEEKKALLATAFGWDGLDWHEERALERYELLYEAGLVAESALDRGEKPPAESSVLGNPMAADHRRIVATALSRLRGKIKYRPVLFDFLPKTFTLADIQTTAETIAGYPFHKQNFRRALLNSSLVEGTGKLSSHKRGRPAELYRFCAEYLKKKSVSGIQTPRIRSSLHKPPSV